VFLSVFERCLFSIKNNIYAKLFDLTVENCNGSKKKIWELKNNRRILDVSNEVVDFLESKQYFKLNKTKYSGHCLMGSWLMLLIG
jgi:hypothetical protein